MRKAAAYFFISLLIASCLDEPECGHSNNDQLGISFKTLFDGKGDTVKIIKVTASGTTDVFNSAVSKSFISLPLNYLTGATAFTIQTADRTYNLDVNFKVKPQFVTEDCPERYVLSNLVLNSSSGIDSIALLNTALFNPAQGNINIYRCPKNELMRVVFRQWYMDTLSRGKVDTRQITSITSDFSGSVYGALSASTVSLPLNISNTQTLYTLTFSDGTTNQLRVQYTVTTQTLFPSCPNGKFPDNLSILLQDYGIPKLRRDSIYDPPRTNIELFRCPITNQLTVVFKNATGAIVTDTLKSIVADFRPDTLYKNIIRSSVVLPLNDAADNTQFHFQYKTKTSVMTLGYTRTGEIYHSECGTQTHFTKLALNQSTNFSVAPKVTVTDVQFPTVTNVEIVK